MSKKITLLLLVLFMSCSVKKGEEIEVYIPENISADSAIQILKNKSVVKNKIIFKFLLILTGKDKSIKSGLYKIKQNEEYAKIIKIISEGKEMLIPITIPEGKTLKEILRIIQKSNIVDSLELYTYVNNYDVKKNLNINLPSLEGLLFPDTYYFSKHSSAKSIITLMIKRFLYVLKELKCKNEFIDTAVIIASLVEKEAMVDRERAIIAGVFYNRLKLGMKLESCATIEYILPEHKERLLFKDLSIDSPFNTYKYSGLPPGPICSPGSLSIYAALNPAKHDYLFFVSKGNGTHYFSKTVREHERMKRKFLIRR